jgi:signal transduction histidine kinase
MRNIFLFCGVCGYVFIPVKMFWPAWRLYDFFMLVLVYFTWRYAWGARDLKVLYSELSRTRKLATDLEASRAQSQRKSFFLNAISHDLRTPLNGLMLQAELAEVSAASNDSTTLRESLSEIKTIAADTAELLNSFLELGRLDWNEDCIQIGQVDVTELLQAVANQHQLAAEQKGLYLRIAAAQHLTIQTDRIKLERILMNLVGNAVKFTASGGITLEVENSAAEVRFRVIDTGEGIAPVDQSMLFQEFFQVSNHERDRKKGFGLGLAIAQKLARQLGGKLKLEQSELEAGSRFCLTIPQAIEPTVRASGGANASPAARQSADLACRG